MTFELSESESKGLNRLAITKDPNAMGFGDREPLNNLGLGG